ncbi:cytochrome bd oxidase small subunit CydS [Pseudalkalibacillus berkeleyi]
MKLENFFIMWAPPLVLLIAIIGLFVWGAKK